MKYRSKLTASYLINFRVAMAAVYAGDGDLAVKHAEISMGILGKRSPFFLDFVAEGYLLKGQTERALEVYAEMGDIHPDWFRDCVRARGDQVQATGLVDTVRETLEQLKTGQLTGFGWEIIRCGAWIGEPDLVFDMLFAKGVPPYENSPTTEVIFINMFHQDGSVLRQDPRFRKLV